MIGFGDWMRLDLAYVDTWSLRPAQEPRRMWRRYLVGNFRFIWIIMRGTRAAFQSPEPTSPLQPDAAGATDVSRQFLRLLS